MLVADVREKHSPLRQISVHSGPFCSGLSFTGLVPSVNFCRTVVSVRLHGE